MTGDVAELIVKNILYKSDGTPLAMRHCRIAVS